jgi:HK97 family phage portal protein
MGRRRRRTRKPSQANAIVVREKALTGVTESRGLAWWWPLVREASAGAWQRNEEISLDNALSNPTLYACITLIASDVAKMRPRLMRREPSGVWAEFENTAHSPVLRRPNHYQNWFQFALWWITSKLTHGNTYALKRRDNRGVVDALYIIDPTRVKLLQAPDGAYFYELSPDAEKLGLPERSETIIVPAREIVHDVMCPLFHPMIGVSPIFAAGWPALLARYILNNSQKLFANGSSPGGVLTAPGNISQATADRVKTYFDTNFSGDNFGKVAVLGDGLTYTPMGMSTAVDSQLIEILRWTDEQIAKCFHMPLFKVGGPLPPYSSVEAVTQIYYSDCLQGHSTPFEKVITDGLELSLGTAMMLDLDDLNRMDSATTMEIATKGVKGGVLTPNDGRRKFDLPPLKGGDTVYLQVQEHSIEVLADRDALGAAAIPALSGKKPEAASDPAPKTASADDAGNVLAFMPRLEAITLKKTAAIGRRNAGLPAVVNG